MTDQPDETYLLLMDPEWQRREGDETPPMRSVVGLWPLSADGVMGRFRSNPEYIPLRPESPTDPIDALLRLAMRGDATMEQVQLVLRDTLLDLAMNGDGRPLVVRSPDDVPCVVVATSAQHQARTFAPEWHRIELDTLIERLADGIDVMINPNGPASVRLTGDFLRHTATLSAEEVAALQATFRGEESVTVVPWEMGAR
ncbi:MULTISPECIES: type VII secretion system-associated protein [Actinoplanes]|uniref:type VII secretion system-associated protein n=1 Tax=Actinoplanes TaxID=1865 RepID=UPI0005F2EB46|nr:MULTISPECIES: type VII secretion system-associated protein [Actinoplanes]GLY00694.1 hypothetical protein Acsp01_10730 [Actinoplanes sp. NBRC 101535]